MQTEKNLSAVEPASSTVLQFDYCFDCQVFGKKSVSSPEGAADSLYSPSHILAELCLHPVKQRCSVISFHTWPPPALGSEFAAVLWVGQTDWAAALDARDPPGTHPLQELAQWVLEDWENPWAESTTTLTSQLHHSSFCISLILSHYLCPLWSRPWCFRPGCVSPLSWGRAWIQAQMTNDSKGGGTGSGL